MKPGNARSNTFDRGALAHLVRRTLTGGIDSLAHTRNGTRQVTHDDPRLHPEHPIPKPAKLLIPASVSRRCALVAGGWRQGRPNQGNH
jgi:hypothetical protein